MLLISFRFMVSSIAYGADLVVIGITLKPERSLLKLPLPRNNETHQNSSGCPK